MVTRRKQQIGGLVMALLGAGFTAWSWHTAINEGYFYGKASMLFPAIFILGVALVVFPGYKEERIARGEDISSLQGWRLITRRWWVILVLALIAGMVNFYLLSSL